VPPAPEARLKIVAENLARAALAELKRDVQGAGTAAAGASTGFGKMVFAHGNLIASSEGARRGVNLIEHGLQTLTTQAIGVPGPIGKIAQGFGLLGAGSLLVTGVLAGVGAVALEYRILTRDAREAGEAADKLTESLKNQTRAGQLRELGAGLTRAQQGIDRGPSIFGLFRDDPVRPGEVGDPILHVMQMLQRAALENAGEKAVAAVMALRDARAQSHTELIKGLEREGDLIGATAAEAARLRASWLGLTEAETANYVAAATRLERRKEENRLLGLQRDLIQQIADISREVDAGARGLDLSGLKRPDIFADEAARQASLQVADIEKQGGQFAFENFNQDFFDQVQGDVSAAIDSFEKAGAKAKDLGTIIVQSFFQATQAIATGTPAGIFGGAGAILGGASHLEGLSKATAGGLGIAGLVASGLGSLFSLFDHSAERRHREMLQAMRDLRPILNAIRSQPIFIGTGGDVRRTVYLAQRRFDRDAIDRGVGAEV
jgi:hypothetical protein